MACFLQSEIRENELFLFNVKSDLDLREFGEEFQTLRCGIIALDIHGKPLGKEYVPVFIGKQEHDLFNKKWLF